MDLIDDIPILDVTEDAETSADELVKQIPLPENAEVDALHIATVNGVNYLLTWNCAHIANAALQPQIEAICRSQDLNRRRFVRLNN